MIIFDSRTLTERAVIDQKCAECEANHKNGRQVRMDRDFSKPLSFLIMDGTKKAVFLPSEMRLVVSDTDGERPITLSYSECRALEILISAAGETLSRDEIIGYAWPDRVVSSGSLNQCVFGLRRILSDDKKHEVIQTVPRRGYRFNPDLLLDNDVCRSPAENNSSIEVEEYIDEKLSGSIVESASVGSNHISDHMHKRRKDNNLIAIVFGAIFLSVVVALASVDRLWVRPFILLMIESQRSKAENKFILHKPSRESSSDAQRDTLEKHFVYVNEATKGRSWFYLLDGVLQAACIDGNGRFVNFSFSIKNGLDAGHLHKEMSECFD